MRKKKLIQKHNQIIFDELDARGPICLGPYSSYTWRHDPKHLIFTLIRYKFCSKILAGKKNVLEIGCGDAVGAPVLLQTVQNVHGIDFESVIIEDNLRRNEYPDRLTFKQLDITKSPLLKKFDAALSLDVIEHIPKNKEQNYMKNISSSLKPQAICIIGTPNITASSYASKNSAEGHINLKSHKTLGKLLEKYFHNVLIFSMNDEIIHTGFYPMAHFLMGIGIGVKRKAGV